MCLHAVHVGSDAVSCTCSQGGGLETLAHVEYFAHTCGKNNIENGCNIIVSIVVFGQTDSDSRVRCF